MKKFFSNTFITASFWMFLATGFVNVGNFIYHGVMGRLLERGMLGELESLISVLYILGIPMTTISLVIIKFVSEYKGKDATDKIAAIYQYFRKVTWKIGLVSSIVMLLLTPVLTNFLHLSSPSLVFLLIINFLISLFVFIDKSVIQGLTHFSILSAANCIEVAGKLILSILLVMLGFYVTGAFAGVVLSGFIVFLFTQLFITKKLKFSKTVFSSHREIYSFTIPVFITTLCLSLIITIDVVLVRHFFPGPLSGDYSAISLLGKVVYFAISPLLSVMFPLVSEYHASGKKYSHILLYSMMLAVVMGIGVILCYIAVPNIFILLLFGKKFLLIAPYLAYFALFMVLYTLSSLLANFYLSIHKLQGIYGLLGAVVLQIVLILSFHASLWQVIYSNIIVSFLLFISLLIYYPYATAQKNNTD